MAKLNRVNSLPTTGLVRGDQYMLNVGGGKYQTYVVSDTLQLTKESGADFIEKDTVSELRSITAREIWSIQNGYYKGVKLNGYYEKGDTPKAIEYYLSDTTEVDDGGGVFEVGGIKLEHDFSKDDFVNVAYFGVFPALDKSLEFQKLITYVNNLPKGDVSTNSSYFGWLEYPIEFNAGEYILKNINIPSNFTRFSLVASGRCSIRGATDTLRENDFLIGNVSNLNVRNISFYNFKKLFDLGTNNSDFAFVTFYGCSFSRIIKVLDQKSYSLARSTTTLFDRCRFGYFIENIADVYSDKFSVKNSWIIHSSDNYAFSLDSNSFFENNVWVPSYSGSTSNNRVYIKFSATDIARSINFTGERFGGEPGSCPIVLVEDVNKSNGTATYKNQGVSFKGCFIVSASTYEGTNKSVVILKKPTTKQNSINYVSFEDCGVLPDLTNGVVSVLGADASILDTIADDFVINMDYTTYSSSNKGVNKPTDSILSRFLNRPNIHNRLNLPKVNVNKVIAQKTETVGLLKATFQIKINHASFDPYAVLVTTKGYGDTTYPAGPVYGSISSSMISINGGYTSKIVFRLFHEQIFTSNSGASFAVNSDIVSVFFDNGTNTYDRDVSKGIEYVNVNVFFGNRADTGEIFVEEKTLN